MSDTSSAKIRERIWVTKFDHATDPPTPVEEVFMENGRVVSVTTPAKEQEERDERARQGEAGEQ